MSKQGPFGFHVDFKVDITFSDSALARLSCWSNSCFLFICSASIGVLYVSCPPPPSPFPGLDLSLPSAHSLSLLTYSIFQPCFPAVSSTTFWPTSHFLPGPVIKACRTASPWAAERGREGWGDWGEGLEEEMDRQGIWHTGGNGKITERGKGVGSSDIFLSKDKKMARWGQLVQQVMVIQTCSLKNVPLQWVFIFSLHYHKVKRSSQNEKLWTMYSFLCFHTITMNTD